jgi:putative spermidine/putrescine transport system permease protein
MESAMNHDSGRGLTFYVLAAFFVAFVLFLYGPTLTILILSFQGPQGGLTFPMNGMSTHWFSKLMEGVGVVDIWAAFRRSLKLGAVVMVITVVFAVAAGLAYRRRFRGSSALFYVVVASLIVPSIVVSLGIGLGFRLLDELVMAYGEANAIASIVDDYTTASGLFTSALGAHLSWTLPFGLLIMFAVFNRFDKSFEEAARDLGASDAQTFLHVVLPIIAPSLVGVALFGFTLSYDELARSTQAAGDLNTLPLELQGLTTTVTTPEIYALGTLTTGVSFAVIGASLAVVLLLRRRREGHGSDAGKGMV